MSACLNIPLNRLETLQNFHHRLCLFCHSKIYPQNYDITICYCFHWMAIANCNCFKSYLFMQEHSVNEWKTCIGCCSVRTPIFKGVVEDEKPHTRQLNIIIEIKLNSINERHVRNIRNWTLADIIIDKFSHQF
jgi:hypothetical protein